MTDSDNVIFSRRPWIGDHTEERNNFLRSNNIDISEFESLNMGFGNLVEIWTDHNHKKENLSNFAALHANIVQKFKHVHSVRWRIKDPTHLILKIIRKKLEKNDKYSGINVYNYHEIVSDLVGIRILHLFKEQYPYINESLIGFLEDKEPTVVYIREGDPTDIYEKLCIATKIHPEGYRSAHYVKTAGFMRRNINIEIQVRTVFEEGWSEIDHLVRYPSLSKDRELGDVLQDLNKILSSADTMASTVNTLALSKNNNTSYVGTLYPPTL